MLQHSAMILISGHSKPKARLMESNPFFSEKAALTSQRPIKFSMKVNSKFIKNPYLSSKGDQEKPKFVGPLLPNGANKSSGYPSQHVSCRENGREHPNSESSPDKPSVTTSEVSSNSESSPNNDKPSVTTSEVSSKLPKTKSDKESSPVSVEKAEVCSSPVVKCTESMSSLDILKNTYNDDSDERDAKRAYNPNAQPVLLVKKKTDTSANKGDGDKLKNGPEQKTSSGNVFERLGAKHVVKSWSGETSDNFKNDNECWKSIMNPNKRVRDEYDNELDQGKVKKVKHHKNKQNGRETHDFQKAHDYQKNQKRWEERSSWGSRQNGGKQPKYFWKNKKQKS